MFLIKFCILVQITEQLQTLFYLISVIKLSGKHNEKYFKTARMLSKFEVYELLLNC